MSLGSILLSMILNFLILRISRYSSLSSPKAGPLGAQTHPVYKCKLNSGGCFVRTWRQNLLALVLSVWLTSYRSLSVGRETNTASSSWTQPCPTAEGWSSNILNDKGLWNLLTRVLDLFLSKTCKNFCEAVNSGIPSPIIAKNQLLKWIPWRNTKLSAKTLTVQQPYYNPVKLKACFYV